MAKTMRQKLEAHPVGFAIWVAFLVAGFMTLVFVKPKSKEIQDLRTQVERYAARDGEAADIQTSLKTALIREAKLESEKKSSQKDADALRESDSDLRKSFEDMLDTLRRENRRLTSELKSQDDKRTKAALAMKLLEVKKGLSEERESLQSRIEDTAKEAAFFKALGEQFLKDGKQEQQAVVTERMKEQSRHVVDEDVCSELSRTGGNVKVSDISDRKSKLEACWNPVLRFIHEQNVPVGAVIELPPLDSRNDLVEAARAAAELGALKAALATLNEEMKIVDQQVLAITEEMR